MKIGRWVSGMLLLYAGVVLGGRYETGSPFFVNYFPEVYGAHDRNEAVVCDREGNCYFANLQGVLKYDGQDWQLVTTPRISRITSLAADRQGKIYAGGYNVAGILEDQGNGKMFFRAYLSDAGKKVIKIGEVRSILTGEEEVIYIARNGLLVVKNDSVQFVRSEARLRKGFYWCGRLLVTTEKGNFMEYRGGQLIEEKMAGIRDVVYTSLCHLSEGVVLVGTNRGLFLFRGLQGEKLELEGVPEDICINDIRSTSEKEIIVATATHGVLFLDEGLRISRFMDESRGLCSNVVNALDLDGKGSLWLATARGISRMLVPSSYSLFTEREGLPGEVLTMVRHQGVLYVGTHRGVFYLDQKKGIFRRFPGISQACWQVTTDRWGRLWMAGSNGVFWLAGDRASLYSSSFTMSIAVDSRDSGRIYTGEQEAVYLNRVTGKEWLREDTLEVGQVNRLLVDTNGTVWMSTVFGEISNYSLTGGSYCPGALKGLENTLGNQIFLLNNRFIATNEGGFYREAGKDSLACFSLLRDSLEQNWWPGLCIQGPGGIVWLTDGSGKAVVAVKEGILIPAYKGFLKGIERYTIRVIYPDVNGVVWLGGSFGLIRLSLEDEDQAYLAEPVVYVRSIVRDSASSGNISFTYATDAAGIIRPVQYSCRLSGMGREWGEWSSTGKKEYMRLPGGKYVFEVRAMDAFGRICYAPAVRFEIPVPVYWRWYAWVGYSIWLLLIVIGLIRWRTRKLLREKERLEQVVDDRTREIRKQRDEISEKSGRLEQTLRELGKAQDELIRQEKMATIGKLTQGLVDRILNPLNYIGNFALLSRNLSLEAIQILKEGEGKIPSDMQEDLKEVMEMLGENLEKISIHGQSTARVLKAMEEILKERKCILQVVEMNELCRETLEQLKEYWKQEIRDGKIRLIFLGTEAEVKRQIDRNQFGKMLLSILSNGIYALLKKAEKVDYEPQLTLKLEVINRYVRLTVRDNGIGIGAEVTDKVFDPFFTTRTTAESAGVGLYLSREVVLNHGGKIGIESEKGQWTCVWIELKKEM